MGDYASCYKNTIWAALRLESERSWFTGELIRTASRKLLPPEHKNCLFSQGHISNPRLWTNIFLSVFLFLKKLSHLNCAINFVLMNVVWIWLDYCSGSNMELNYVIYLFTNFLHADDGQDMKKQTGGFGDEPDIKDQPR